jgi:hypothetical protein
MTFKTALEIAKQVKEQNPEYILCGSVALILAGVIPEREVGDIDFIAPSGYVNESLQKVMDNYPSEQTPTVKTGYTTYKDNIGAYYYNVYKHVKGKIKTQVVNGIKIQKVEDILKYKKQYARPKDIYDLTSRMRRYYFNET